MNFLEPTPFARVLALARRVSAAWLATLAILFGLVMTESMRLRECEHREARLQIRHDAVFALLRAEESRTAALRSRIQLLTQALAIRRATALRAAEIATIGNALPRMVALTALREYAGSWQVEGQGPYLGAVRTALARLDLSSANIQIVAVRRDARGEVVSFELELAHR